MVSIAERRKTLTTRQVEILGLSARGMLEKEVGRELRISPQTVKNHLARHLTRQERRQE